MKSIYLLFFILLSYVTKAQTNIKGIILNKELNAVSVVVYEKNKLSIIAYSISNSKGYDLLVNSVAADSLDIEVSHIGYKIIKKRIENKSQTIDFTLSSVKIELPPIIIDSKLPIAKRGDTLTYDVKAFAAKTDRVIADVIKKLPGIEIEPNGQIKYNGKAISNYYIEGLDLLESRYNIANNNLPADMVEKVQVLENHQPIKALDSSIFSDNAALNIKLTKNAKNKFITTAKIGAGIAPFLWQDEIVTLNFRKKFQFISGYKTNNTGTNLSNELNVLFVNQFDKLNALTKKQDLLSLINNTSPPFEEKRYLFNKTHLLYTNGLFVTDKSSQLKYNISYLNEKKIKSANTQTTFFLPQDTINIIENQSQNSISNNLLSDFGFTVNKAKFYLKNDLKIEGYWSKETGIIKNLTDTVLQKLNNPLYQIINNFHLIFSKPKNKLEFNSNTVLQNLPQELNLLPGQFAGFFNQNVAYSSLLQKATKKTFLTDNYLLLRKHLFAFNQTIKLGFSYTKSSIISFLEKNNQNTITLLADSMKNNLHWQEIKPYAELGFYIVKKGYRVDFTSTILNNTLQRNDLISGVHKTTNCFFLNTSLMLKKDLGPYYSFSASIKTNTDINGINENTLGYILTTYRNISKNNFALQKNKTVNSNLFLTYRNPLKTLFGYISASYSISNKDLLNEFFYYNKLETKNTVELKNKQTNFVTFISLNKFLKKSKTSLGISGFISNSKYPLLQLNSLNNIYNNTTTLKFNFSTRKFDWINPEFNILYSKSRAKIISVLNTINPKPIYQVNGNLSLNFFIAKYIILTSTSSYYLTYASPNGGNKNLFLDLALGYKKGKYDIEFKLLNISNIKNFKTVTSSDNIQIFSSYQLRPINALIQFYLKL